MAAHAVEAAPGHLAGVVVGAATGQAGVTTMAIVQGVLRMYRLAKVKLVAMVIAGPMLMGALILAADRMQSGGASAGGMVASTQAADDKLVLADLSDVTSYHIRARRLEPGAGDRLVYESLYDRARGVVTYDYYAAPCVHISVDDGESQWRFRQNGPVIGRRKSRTTLAEVPVELGREIEDWVSERKPVRDASGDRIVDGVRYRCFRAAADPKQGGDDTAAWVDSRNYVVRQVRTAGDGQVEETEIAYNVPVDAARFPSTRPANGEMVELDRYLEKVFPLDDAILTRESCGLMFAVHHLEQDGEGRFHLICSTRPTEASRAALKPMDLFDYAGGGRLDSFSYSVERIAHLGGSGMEVGYYVLVPYADRPRFVDWCEFTVNARSVNVLGDHLKAKSAATEEKFQVELEVRRPGNPPMVRDFAARTYETAARLEGLVNASINEVVVGPGNRAEIRYRYTTQIAKEAFLRNVEGRMERKR
jgi:hypothetical protein